MSDSVTKGSSVHGLLQTRTQESVAIFYSGDLSDPDFLSVLGKSEIVPLLKHLVEKDCSVLLSGSPAILF